MSGDGPPAAILGIGRSTLYRKLESYAPLAPDLAP